MKLEYRLFENDFLEYSLFSASQSKRISIQRKKTWLILSLAFIMISIPFFQKNDDTSYFFIGFAIVTFIFYPTFQKHQYKRHYRKHVIENYKARFGVTSTLTFKDDQIETESIMGETKINYSVIEQIDETGNYFFLKLKTGSALIIPKNEIPNIPDFKVLLETLAQNYSWENATNLNWKWK